MRVNIENINEALTSIIADQNQIVPLDANILIPPDRSNAIKDASIGFEYYKKVCLDNLFSIFPQLAIHESVYEELTPDSNLIKYIDEQIEKENLIFLSNFDLNDDEKIIFRSIENSIAKYTNYDPQIDNRNDRGEVKSLAYIQVKELIYFCTNDSKALRLVEKAEELETSLEEVSTITMYEVIYFLYKNDDSLKKDFRFLYKFLYRLTEREKRNNPSWENFIKNMNELYTS